MMRKHFWVVAVMAVLLMAVSQSPRYLEELRIGGGLGDIDGGASHTSEGNIATDGSIAAGGTLTMGSGGHLLTDASGLVDGGKLQLGSVLSAVIGTDTIVAGNIAANSVGNSEIINTDDFTFDNVTATGTITTNGKIIIEKTNTQEIRFDGTSTNIWRIISTINGGTDGELVFQHTTDRFTSNFLVPLRIDPSGLVTFSGKITTPAEADAVLIGPTPTLAAHDNADNLVVMAAGTAGMTLGTNGTSADIGIWFADSDNTGPGRVFYSHSTDELRFATTNGVTRTTLDEVDLDLVNIDLTVTAGDVNVLAGNLSVAGDISATSPDVTVTLIDSDPGGAASGGRLRLQLDDGAATTSGHRLGVLHFGGYDGTAMDADAAAIRAFATEDFVNGSNGGAKLEMYVTQNGTTAEVLAFRLDQDLSATFYGHIVSTQASDPTGTVGAALNDGVGETITITGTDSAGRIDILSGDGTMTSGLVCTIMFDRAYATAPKSVIVSSASTWGSVIKPYVDNVTTTKFEVHTAGAGAASAAHDFYYWVIE